MGGLAMCKRDANLLWLKDTLEQMQATRQHLQWTEDSQAIQLLTETMLRDLARCRRLCESLRGRAELQPAG
jgi:hypothetical protein